MPLVMKSVAPSAELRRWFNHDPGRWSGFRDSYFQERNLYPNVDFYTGITYRAMGFPTNMFTVMFAIGRLPGWIAQWKESMDDPNWKICRPRQVYTGATEYDFVPIHARP